MVRISRQLELRPTEVIWGCNLFEVLDQVQRNNVQRLFLRLDEVQIAPNFAKPVVRGCAAIPLGKVRVFPVLSGLSTLKVISPRI